MEKRKTTITRNYLMYPHGSVLIETGKTKVLCTVFVEENVPGFLLNSNPLLRKFPGIVSGQLPIPLPVLGPLLLGPFPFKFVI